MIEAARIRPVPSVRIAGRIDGEVGDALRKAAVGEHDESPARREIGEIRLRVGLATGPNFAVSRGCNFGYEGDCLHEEYALAGGLGDV